MGSLNGRVRRLETRRTPGEARPRSRTELEARALDAEIRELEARALDAEIRELERETLACGGNPDEWRPELDAQAALSLDEQIAALEEEIDLWQ